MKKRIVSMVVGLLMLVSASARAETPGLNAEEIRKALGMSVYLQAGYTYNFKNPDSQENGLRVFDHKSNSFSFDLAQLVFAKDAPTGGVGFKLKLSAGETAKWIHSRGLGSGDDPFDLTEAYIDYLAPLGRGLKLRFGKFVTMHGAEVIEAKDNVNYSRGLLFNYAIPFTHTGLMASYPFSDKVSGSIYLVNGWDNTDDNNKGKTLGLSAGLTPMEQLSMVLNLMYGPEQDDNSSNNRFLLDWVATIKPVKDLSLILNVDYATDEDAVPDGKDAKWYGLAGIVKYDINDLWSIAARAEYFNDKDGVRTGSDQKLKEITITPEFRIAKSIIVRPEYRHDWSDKESFNGRKTQDTIALGVMYTW